jgi:glucoamylase
VRLNPSQPGEVVCQGEVDKREFALTGQAPGARSSYPARDIVDAGFLQLVRYGIFSPDDRLVVDSLKVIDAVLKVATPSGPCWHRYNHDGYGQRRDGSAFCRWGKGRVWPLLTGERAHYELANQGDWRSLLHALEHFSTSTDLLPEQIWDDADLPGGARCGDPTGSANPLLWAHSEYIRLLRSLRDGAVFDLIPEVAARYRVPKARAEFDFWLSQHPISQICAGRTLRICTPEPFRLRWSNDGWRTYRDDESRNIRIGAEYFDIASSAFHPSIEFTFFWKRSNRWEGRNYSVQMASDPVQI